MNPESTTQSTYHASPIDRPGRHLADPIRLLDLPDEARRLREEESWGREGHTARTLVKNESLRIVLVDMRSGSRLGWHRTQSRISIQVVTGMVSVLVPEAHHVVAEGQLLAVDASISHDVEALEDSTFLLTLARES